MYLLLYFKLNNSLLTLVLPLRTLIVLFYKKYILIPYLMITNLLFSISIYNKFIFFNIFNNFVIYKSQINVV